MQYKAHAFKFLRNTPGKGPGVGQRETDSIKEHGSVEDAYQEMKLRSCRVQKQCAMRALVKSSASKMKEGDDTETDE